MSVKATVKVMASAAAALAIGAGAPAAAQTAGDRVAYLAQAKAVFERACSVCHPLERPLSKTFDQAGWEKTVDRMHDNGAEVNQAERAQVVAYLLAKNTFEAKCSACHGTDRPLGKAKAAADWLATVQRMAGKKPGHLAEAEVADVAAYLSIVRPQPK
jgi:mono/diheme cytochrome c family protein